MSNLKIPPVQTFEIGALPKLVRKELATALAPNTACPGLIFANRRSLVGQLLSYTCLLALAGFVLFLYAQGGFGEVSSPEMHDSPYSLLVYGGSLATMALAILGAWRAIVLHRRLPFAPGSYLFPRSMLVAESTELTLLDLNQLTDERLLHKRDSNGQYLGSDITFQFGPKSKYVFSMRNRNAAMMEKLLQHIPTLRDQEQAMVQSQDLKGLLQLDPLYAVRTGRIKPGASKPGPNAIAPLAPFFRWRIGIALLLGGLISLPLWYMRNKLSDDAAYASLATQPYEKPHQEYLQHGRYHIAEVQAALPRIALKEALDKRSVTALRTVLQRYPAAGLEGEGKAAIHQLYQSAFEKFKRQAAASDPTLVPFMQALLATLETSGNPAVQIRFSRPTTEALAQMDEKLSAYARQNQSTMAPAAPQFEADTAAVREARIIEGLQRGFSVIFPNDVLSLSHTKRINDKLPLLDIAYQIQPSGQVYTSKDDPNDKRMFVGLICNFDANVTLPDQPLGWQFALSVEPPDVFEVPNEGISPLGNLPPAERVYRVMAERAFDTLNAKLRAALFNPESEAYKRFAVAKSVP